MNIKIDLKKFEKEAKRIGKIDKVVLGYSGGLDTSISIPFIKKVFNADVIAVTVDTGGFSNEFLKQIKEKALKVGATKHYIINKEDELFNEFVSMTIKANALYEGKYPLCAAIERYTISKTIVEIAKKENADAVAFGASGLENEQVRFEITCKALMPEIEVLLPIRDFNLFRDWEKEFAKKFGVPIADAHETYTINVNMLGRTIAGSEHLNDPWKEPPEDAFQWTASPTKAPSEPEYVEIEFDKGVPVALNEKKMSGSEILRKSNTLAGKHGIGRIDMMEDHILGTKWRYVYEAPAALTLIPAHIDLEMATLPKSILDFKKNVEQKWTNLIYEGLWIDPLRSALESFINDTQDVVSGIVKMKLFKGKAEVVGRRSPNSLFAKELISYQKNSSKFNQTETKNFIKFFGLQSRLAFIKKQKIKRLL